MRKTKTKHVKMVRKGNQKKAFHELKQALKIGYNWMHILGVMLVFLLNAGGGE